MTFITQAGGCADNACGVARAARKSEVASPSAPLSSQLGASVWGAIYDRQWSGDLMRGD